VHYKICSDLIKKTRRSQQTEKTEQSATQNAGHHKKNKKKFNLNWM